MKTARSSLRGPAALPLSSSRGRGGILRPFFSYYGAKWTSARHYGPPRFDLVIEPFAGSAAYSVYWSAANVRLYDVSADICDLWHFLIHSTERDIAAIPDYFNDFEQIASLSRGARLLVSFWVAKGRAEPSNAISPWYFQYCNASDCRVWGPAVKARIIKQKPAIARWTVDCLPWRQVPLERGHWHVDPPYNNAAGRRYPHSSVDYEALASWCQALPGHVDVCENVGADWLPFVPSHSVVSSRGRRDGGRSQEAVWTRGPI